MKDLSSATLGDMSKPGRNPGPLLLPLLVMLAAVGASRSTEAAQATPEYVLDGSRVFWWVQITDTHVDSVYLGNEDRLVWALYDGIPVVEPAIVVATGDLTDSTNGLIYGFGPYEAEWQEYRSHLDNAGMTPDFYFDVPGNHDAYNDGDNELFLDYGMWGAEYGTTQPQWLHETPFGDYLFIGLCTAGNNGRQWPADDERLTAEELAEVEDTLDTYGDTADQILMFGHHDYRNAENHEELDELFNPYGWPRFYFHGHTHDHHATLDENGVLVYRINTLGQGGSDNFAVWAVDADAVSVGVFDAEDAWPAIVVTAPVDARLQDAENPYAPAIPNTCTEAPVRALVFDEASVTAVAFRFDESDWIGMESWPGIDAQWRGSFDASTLAAGWHDLSVAAIGSKERSVTVQVRVEDGECNVGTEDTPPDPDAGPDVAPDMGIDIGPDAGTEPADLGRDSSWPDAEPGADGRDDAVQGDIDIEGGRSVRSVRLAAAGRRGCPRCQSTKTARRKAARVRARAELARAAPFLCS